MEYMEIEPEVQAQIKVVVFLLLIGIVQSNSKILQLSLKLSHKSPEARLSSRIHAAPSFCILLSMLIF